MAGRIDVMKGVVYATGRKYYLDKTINAGTRSLFHMAEVSKGGGANLVAGAVINDLTYNANTGTFSLAKVFSGGGMQYAGLKNDGFDLDANAIMKTTDTHWMFSTWLKITQPGSVSSFNNQTLHFSTAATNNASAALLSLVPTLNASGVPTQIELHVRGKGYTLLSQLTPLYDGAVHQFAVECELSSDGANQTVKVYLDKTLVYSNTAAVAGTTPGTPTNRRVGTTNSLPLAWKGSLYRVRVDDIALGGVAAADILTADYALCASRFS